MLPAYPHLNQVVVCSVLVFFWFATLSTYWEHIEANGANRLAGTFLIGTFGVSALFCELREMLYVRHNSSCGKPAPCRAAHSGRRHLQTKLVQTKPPQTKPL